MATKACNFRFPPDVVAHLDALCRVSEVSRTAFLSAIIEREYDQYQGNPELQKLISQIQDMKKQLDAMTIGKK